MKITSVITKEVFLPDDEHKASVTIKYLKSGVRDLIDLKCTVEGKGFDYFQMRMSTICELVIGWDGFFGADGEKLELNNANLLLVTSEDESFSKFLYDESTKLIKEVEEQEKKDIKN